MKKIICIALALVMLLGLAVSASAYNITVSNSDDGATVAGHTYNVYQIFKGDLEELGTDKVLTNLVYGKNYGTEDEKVPDTVLDTLDGMNGEQAAAYVEADIKNEAIAVLNDANSFTASGLAVGYYLIIDVTENLPENESKSAFILEVTDNVEIKSKHTAGPVTEKKIDDKNDSNTSEDAINWQDSADHDIGDLIDFQLKATLPAAFQLFLDNDKEYYFAFHDTEEQGLSFQSDSVVVKIDGNIVDEDNYTVVYPATDGHTFDVIFDDVAEITGADVGSVLTVEYKSRLNENAVLGKQGNVNKVFGEFRNYYEPETPVYTPEDFVIAFTYKVEINKVDQEEQPLSGATFTLEKFVANAESGAEVYEGVKGDWVALSTVETEPDTTFTFKGIDDGEYRLKETVTPDGYNSIDDVYFTVGATHAPTWIDLGKRSEVLTDLSGDVVSGEIEFEKSAANGTLTSDVVNKAGALLPETGGVGTTIFYILGAALAVCAVVVLVTRRRMTAEG